MKKVPQGFDFSFLNEEEARKILQVLERNEELRRAEKDRISKLQKTKRDIRWLQGATGEWFEEIQRKKFCNETDVNQMLRPPLTYRLQKGMAKNDPMELQTSRSKNLINQKPSVSSRMSFRSSFASLFSFRRSGKESQRPSRCDEHVRPPASVRGTAAAKLYTSPVGSQPVASVFVPKAAIMREESGMPPPWDASLLEREFFQVLDDLDSKLAEEQSTGSMNARIPFNYGSRTQFKLSHRTRQDHGTGRHQNYHSETSNMSIYDILRPGTPREGFKTFSPRTKTIYDMYRTREPRVLKEDFTLKNAFGSASLCFDSRQRSASPVTGRFTARSLHFPANTQNKTSFTPVRHQQSPKRTPLSSIIWNRPDASRHGQDQEESLGIPAPMDIDPAEQYVSPRYFQENRRYEVCHSQNAYQSYPFNVPVDNAMSPDALENSENMPFYRQNNLFARSFFSSTFRQSREQRFGQNSFWSRQEEHSSWSDFPQSRKPFPCSDKDFEMISVDANRVPSVYSHGVPSQHWRPRSPGCGTYVFRGQEDAHCWRSEFRTCPLENMDTSHVNENQFPPHLVTPDGFSVADSSCPVQSSGLDSQQGYFPVEEAADEDPRLFGKTQNPVSSFRTPFPLSPDDRRESRSSSFQNSTATLQKIIPNKPDSLPMRNCVDVPVACSHSAESLSLTETQPNVPVTETHSEKDMDVSISEDEQLNKMGQKNRPTGLPQSVSRTVISNDVPDFQNAPSQDSTPNDRYGFNAPATEHSRRSPRLFSRKGTSQVHTTQRDQSDELSKSKCFSGGRRLDSAASLPFIQESGTTLPSPNQGCHQKTGGDEDSSSTIKNSHWCFEPITNQNSQPPEETILDLGRQQGPSTHSTDGSKLAAGHSVSRDPLHVSSDAPQDSFLNALLVPSTAVFSRSLSDQDSGQEQREEKATKSQNNQLAVNPTDNQESHDGPALLHDAVHCHPYSPLRSGRGKGRVRRRVSCIEKLTKTESREAPTREGSGCAEDQSGSKSPELNTVYCTLPRKPASFLLHSGQRESKAASVRNGPLPFQIKNKADVPTEESTSDKPRPPESASDAANSVMGTPKATKRMTDMKAIRSASVRKGPLPFLIQRAVSCPSGEPCTLAEKSPVLDMDASVIPRPGGRIFNSLEDDSSFRESAFFEKELVQEQTGKNSEPPAPRMSSFTVLDKNSEPFCAVGSGRGSGRALHKFKTTSVFSVSGNEENIKCLEVVSIYYTLPRKPSKKFCSLLQQYAQGAGSLSDAFQEETKGSPNAVEIGELNCPTQRLSGTPPPQDLKMQVDSPESETVSQLTDREASKSTLEEMASVEPDVSLHRKEPKIEAISPRNVSKTTVDDSLNRGKRGKELVRQILQTPSLLQEKDAGEEKTKSHQQPSKGGSSDPSGLPSHSEGQTQFKVVVKSLSPKELVRIYVPKPLDRNDGTFLVRYRMHETVHEGLKIEILYGGEHVAQSPYILKGPVYHEYCDCPEDDPQAWQKTLSCPANEPQIEQDFISFPSINLQQMLKEVPKRFGDERGAIVHYTILNNHIYRRSLGKYTDFKMFSDEILLSLARKVTLPDLEFYINLGDWPLEHRKVNDTPGPIPIISWCGSLDSRDIILPTYDVTHSTLEAMRGVTNDLLSVQGNTGPSWINKTEKAFFRGRDSREERLQLVLLSKENPQLLDAGITGYFFFQEKEKELGKAKLMGFFDFFKYKYQVNVDGTVAAYRYPYLMLGDSLVLKQESPYYEHFYVELRPWKHYVPIKRNLSDLLEKVKWAKENDEEAKRIAKEGQLTARDLLQPPRLYCYYYRVLQKYAERQVSKPMIRDGMERVPQPDDSTSVCQCHRKRPEREEL